LVIGSDPEVDSDASAEQSDQDAQAVAAMGRVKATATELGLTIIPAWKLQSYLRTIDDTLTTPMGSAVRGEDFPPEAIPGSKSRLPTDIAEIYKTQTEGLQKGNKVLPP